MNKKMQLILDIMRLSIEISENSKTDVFLEYCGTENLLDIRIYKGVWTSRRVCDYDRYVYLNIKPDRTEEDVIKRLEEIYAEIAKYKEELNANS